MDEKVEFDEPGAKLPLNATEFHASTPSKIGSRAGIEKRRDILLFGFVIVALAVAALLYAAGRGKPPADDTLPEDDPNLFSYASSISL